MAAAELESLVDNCISKHGVHLIEIAIKGEGNGKTVEVFIDAEQGVTTEMCSEVSREVGEMIESSGVVRGSYRLTVSSPGIARPLKFVWQYKKHIGRQLSLRVRSQDGERDVVGKMESMDENEIVLSSGKNTAPESIGFDSIVEARVVAPW